MEIYIGMSLEDACKLIGENDNVCAQDMKNGYYWLRGDFTLFGVKTYMCLCFKEGLLWMMEVMPHYGEAIERQPYQIHPRDRKCCQEWLEKNKDRLPPSAAVCEDPRSASISVVVR